MSILPRKIPKPPNRSSRWRSQAHLRHVRSHHCSWPDCPDMPIEAAHVRMGSGAGMGEKPSDFFAVSLCSRHHRQQHGIGEETFWMNYKRSSGQSVEDLIEAFIQASPKRAEILAHRAKSDGNS